MNRIYGGRSKKNYIWALETSSSLTGSWTVRGVSNKIGGGFGIWISILIIPDFDYRMVIVVFLKVNGSTLQFQSAFLVLFFMSDFFPTISLLQQAETQILKPIQF